MTVQPPRVHQVAVSGGVLAVDVMGRPPGTAPAVVLVHGGTSTAAVDWDPVVPWLLEAFHVVRFDLRGHGRSTGLAGGIGIRQFGRDLLAVMAAVGLSSAGLVGCSVGAHTILALAAEHPDVARAIVTIGAGRRGDPSRVARITNGPWLPALERIEHVEAADADHWRRLRHALTLDWADNHDLTDDHLAAVTCPVLVVHGDRDRVQPPAGALRLAGALPDAQAFVVPDAGHMAQADRPDLVGPAVAAFLTASLTGRPRAATALG